MVPDWQEVAKKAHRRVDPSNIAQAAAAGLGVAFAIGGMEWSSLAAHYPLVLIPFATSIVLVVGSPDVEPAQPRALVGGHLVWSDFSCSTWRGRKPGPPPRSDWPCSRCTSQERSTPAGINPLLVVSGGLPWSFLVAPVLSGALLLMAFAYLWHRLILGRAWPLRWL
jgi:CBS-domain-containing membrane protein